MTKTNKEQRKIGNKMLRWFFRAGFCSKNLKVCWIDFYDNRNRKQNRDTFLYQNILLNWKFCITRSLHVVDVVFIVSHWNDAIEFQEFKRLFNVIKSIFFFFFLLFSSYVWINDTRFVMLFSLPYISFFHRDNSVCAVGRSSDSWNEWIKNDWMSSIGFLLARNT